MRRGTHTTQRGILLLNFVSKHKRDQLFYFFSLDNVLFSHKLQPKSPAYPPNLFTPPSRSLEIVLLIAPAACGKSTITRRFDSSVYSRVNQDSLRTLDRCIATATQEIKKGDAVDHLHVETLCHRTSAPHSDNINSASTVLSLRSLHATMSVGLNVVIDNTNIAVETRAHWIALARREAVQASQNSLRSHHAHHVENTLYRRIGACHGL